MNFSVGNGKITFVSNFNEPLDKYYYVMLGCDSLEFDESVIDYKNSRFNRLIEFLPKCLKNINFGVEFRSLNTPLPKYLEKLQFGFWFDSQFSMPKYLNYLLFKSSVFDKIIKLSKHLKHITFGWTFNKEIILSKNLSYVRFGYNFNKIVIIPKHVTYLYFGYSFNQLNFLRLPQHITHIGFKTNTMQKIILPESLESIDFLVGKNVCTILDNFPHNLIFVYCEDLRYGQPINIHKYSYIFENMIMNNKYLPII